MIKEGPTVQLRRLSPERLDKWLEYYKIILQPHQRRLVEDILRLDSLNIHDYQSKYEEPGAFPIPQTFAALGSGLSFALDTAEKFIKDLGDTPWNNEVEDGRNGKI